MERFKMLSNNFYSLDLHTGKTNFKLGRNILCYFIVEHPCSEEFIREQALQLLMTPCRNFDFYGAYSRQWDVGFDSVDIMLHPNNEEEFSLTSQWDDFDSFIDSLELAISCRYLVPCDIYLIYDDKKTYINVLKALLKSEWVQQFHPDWWKIVYNEDVGK